MDLAVEVMGSVAVVTILAPELDASNTGEFKQQMASIIGAHSRVLIDLSRVRFVDSSGLGAMLSCLRQLTAKGGALELCGMSRQVRAAFELVRLHRILDIYESRAEALEAFR